MKFNSIHFLYALLFIVMHTSLTAQNKLPNPALIGYFHNWNSVNTPYIPLDEVDDRYNVIIVAFAMPINGTNYYMGFEPDGITDEKFIAQIKKLQAQGKKVLVSIGGATAVVKLNSASEKDIFTYSLSNIIEKYGFDGFDIDLEGKSISLTEGTIDTPEDNSVKFLIQAIKQVKTDYKKTHNKNLILAITPETAAVQGGKTKYTGIWGSYLPILQGLCTQIDLLQVQLYNSGSMYGIDEKIYKQGTADFIIAMTEAVIQGFETKGGEFYGFPAEKIAVGLPSCNKAAGSGYTSPEEVKKAIDYLLGKTKQPGKYTLQDPYGYPKLRGMMTWSINWDSNSKCDGTYQYAENFKNIFNRTQLEKARHEIIKFYPISTDYYITVPADKIYKDTHVEITNMNNEIVMSQDNLKKERLCIDFSENCAGMYYMRLVSIKKGTTVFKMLKN